ncbi:hypothetical protein [Paraburkholderia tropica]|uniref:hypothetical protein n=1 Tax=Paraburkholderia tropica TaxID=92647 RepID=UPI003D2CB75E
MKVYGRNDPGQCDECRSVKSPQVEFVIETWIGDQIRESTALICLDCLKDAVEAAQKEV